MLIIEVKYWFCNTYSRFTINSEEVKIANLLSKIGDFGWGEDGFAFLRKSHGGCECPTREDGFVYISACWAEIEDRLGLALDGGAHPRRI